MHALEKEMATHSSIIVWRSPGTEASSGLQSMRSHRVGHNLVAKNALTRLMLYVAAAAKSLQSCLTLHNPIDYSPPGYSISGILQARILEWVAISFSNACMHAKSLQLCLTLCNPMDSSPPGSSVHRILQTRMLEQIAFSMGQLQGL